MRLFTKLTTTLLAGGGNIGAQIRSDLTCGWHMNEVSAEAGAVTRVDYISAMNLTDNNTCPSADGANVDTGNAVRLTRAESEQLTRASEATLQTGNIFYTFSGLLYLESKPANYAIIAKGIDGVSMEFRLLYELSSDKLRFQAFNGTTSVGLVVTSAVVPLQTWFYFDCGHDPDLNQVWIYADTGAGDTEATASTTGDPAVNTQAFRVGTDAGGSFADCRVDELGFHKNKRITAAERAYFVNGGNFRPLPE